jgi:D-inositol-3-phosphate glycosyltransferase
VAAAVGGLRTLVVDGITGFLVDGRDPAAYAARITRILDDPALATDMSRAAAVGACQYTWSTAAARLRRLYADISARALVECA